MRFLTSMIVALNLAAVCGCQMSQRLPDNRWFPKEPAFSIAPEPVSERSGLDFDAVYYLANDKVPGLPPYGGGNYYRFWANGRVLVTMTRTDGPPSAAEADGFQSAYLGYYRVAGNQVEMELYAPDPVAMQQRSYTRVIGSIDKNGDIVRIGDDVHKSRSVFVKTRIAGMKRTPDW